MHIVEATSSTCPLNSGCADKSLPNSNKNNDEVLKISNDKKPMKQLSPLRANSVQFPEGHATSWRTFWLTHAGLLCKGKLPEGSEVLHGKGQLSLSLPKLRRTNAKLQQPIRPIIMLSCHRPPWEFEAALTMRLVIQGIQPFSLCEFVYLELVAWRILHTSELWKHTQRFQFLSLLLCPCLILKSALGHAGSYNTSMDELPCHFSLLLLS